MTSIALQLDLLQQEIVKNCAKRQNFIHKVDLLAVSKRHSADKIRQAYQSGQRLFAENYVQEGVEKCQQLADLDICWHMIGAIQSRKCALIAEHFDWVQSVDRAKVAQKLSASRSTKLAPLNICLQVNLFDEAQKAGANKEQALELAQLVEELPNLKLRGIMAIPPKKTSSKQQSRQFAEIAYFYKHLASIYPNIDTLSMGMSADFVPAIEQGSSMVRVGTAIFGARE